MDIVIKLLDLVISYLATNLKEPNPHEKAVELINARKAAKAIDAEIDAKIKAQSPKP